MKKMKELNWTKDNPRSMRVTQIENVVVSTIRLDDEIRSLDILLGSLVDSNLSTPGNYETMVFPCDKEGKVTDWGELDFARYSTDQDALIGHMDMCSDWASKK